MKVSAWIGIFSVTGLLALGACSSEEDSDGTGGSAGSTGGSAGSTGGSAGSTGGSAGSTGGSAGSTGGSAGSTGGSAGSTGGSAGAGDGGLSCGDCLDSKCKTEGDACQADTDCAAIYNCYATNCQSPDAGNDCAADCIAANPGGQALFTALLTCGATNCLAECS